MMRREIPSALAERLNMLALRGRGGVVTQLQDHIRVIPARRIDSEVGNVSAMSAPCRLCDPVSIVVKSNRPRACKALGYGSEIADYQCFTLMLILLLHRTSSGTGSQRAGWRPRRWVKRRGGRGSAPRGGSDVTIDSAPRKIFAMPRSLAAIRPGHGCPKNTKESGRAA